MTTRISAPEFALEVKRDALQRGASPNHPHFMGRFARRIHSMIIDGHVEAQRLRGRWYVDPELAPRVAEIMGLVPAGEDKALYQSAKKNPPAATNG